MAQSKCCSDSAHLWLAGMIDPTGLKPGLKGLVLVIRQSQCVLWQSPLTLLMQHQLLRFPLSWLQGEPGTQQPDCWLQHLACVACEASQGIQNGCKQLLVTPAMMRHSDSNILLKDANKLGLLLRVTSDGLHPGKPIQHQKR